MTDLAPAPSETHRTDDGPLCHLFVWDQSPNDPVIAPPVGTPSACGLSTWGPGSYMIHNPRRRCAVCLDLDPS